MTHLIALFSGVLFGVGLTVSQMVNPSKVLDFLDVAAIRTGTWDPSLLMVFAGALPVMFIAYRLKGGMQQPLFERAFSVPTRSDIDLPLVGGSAIFGIGWGLAGLCPGPAVTMLPLAGSSLSSGLIYGAAMLAGVAMAAWLRDLQPRAEAA